MNAEIIAVGSELLTPARVDTNSLYLTEELNALGVEVVAKAVVGDDRKRLAEAVRTAVSRSEIVITTGGLGSTEDDVTREAVADALGRKLVYHQEICDAIEARFRRLGRRMAQINKRQAWIIEGAEGLDNSEGTAPGQWIPLDERKVLLLLPGPPRELKPMFTRDCVPRLRKIVPPQVIRVRRFRVAGMPESDLDQLISPVYKRYSNPVTTVLAAPGDIQIHLRARSATNEEAERLLKEVGAQIEALLGDHIYSRDGQPLEAVVGRRLAVRGAWLAVAESCTGGLLAQRITAIPGASNYFKGGFLVYTDEMKRDLLGVSAALIEKETAVSKAVAEAMARGVRERTRADFAVAVTGEAGPESGSGRPVGTVWVAVLSPEGMRTEHRQWLGDRERIRILAAQQALDLLRRTLEHR